ncbi:hypothetical protein [Pedobacter sp. MC2016-24]|uniref:hypothetical protein n=1 Tax=Pedobacter sp. MC2016-24 TaxID=2780090 RepID=UPI00187FD005|nr:hypothetical protein [Pedobacter sp. MC2016-24]MBE9600325.1 hypothetical protein [Pedobacter sp. MC2016-24]
MVNNQILKISGMLNQHEFIERYIFTMQRVINGFSRHEMSFLFGKTTYEINDYEHLSEHVKLSYQDYELMALVFEHVPPSVPVFQTRIDNIDVSAERRMIRGTVSETESERHFQFVHPWKIKGEDVQITITEDLYRNAEQDLQINEFVYEFLLDLKKTGCFDRGCTALFLYQKLNLIIAEEWKPRFLTNLRDLVYAHIYSNEFQIQQQDGLVFYKTKK